MSSSSFKPSLLFSVLVNAGGFAPNENLGDPNVKVGTAVEEAIVEENERKGTVEAVVVVVEAVKEAKVGNVGAAIVEDEIFEKLSGVEAAETIELEKDLKDEVIEVAVKVVAKGIAIAVDFRASPYKSSNSPRCFK